MLSSNKKQRQTWGSLGNEVKDEISRFYVERVFIFACYATIVSLGLSMADMLPRLTISESSHLMSKDYINLTFVLLCLIFTLVVLRIKRGAAPEQYGLIIGAAFVILVIGQGLLLLLLPTTISMPEVYLIMIFLGTAGGIPLPTSVMYPIFTTGFLSAAILVNLRQTTHVMPILSTLILLAAALLAMAINLSNFRHLKGMISNRHRLEEARQRQDSFFALLAHDLRNPIGTLPKLVELHMEELTEAQIMTSERRELLELVTSTTLNTFQLLENLLHWGENRSKMSDHNAVPLMMTELIAGTLQDFSPLFRSKSLIIDTSFGPVPPVISSPEHLQTILRNILSNAVKYSPPGGRILVSLASSDDDSLRLTVADEGDGMKTFVIEEILAGMPVSSRPGSRGEKGSGMGMSLSMKMIREIDAELEIESAPGKGSAVSVLLKSAPRFTPGEVAAPGSRSGSQSRS